jgi:hypothetical protein
MMATINFKRVLLPVPHEAMDEAASRMAVDFAKQLDLDVLGFFVEDMDMLALGELPFVRELRSLEGGWMAIDSERLATEARLAAQRAERRFLEMAERVGAKSMFKLVQGTAADAIASLSRAGDIVIIGESLNPADKLSHSQSQLTESALQSEASVMLVPSRIAQQRGPIAVIAAAPDEAGVGAALSIAGATKTDLVIVNTGERPGSDWVIPSAAVPPGVEVRLIQARSSATAMGTTLSSRLEFANERLLIMTHGTWEDSLALAFAAERRVPVLIIEPEGPRAQMARRLR